MNSIAPIAIALTIASVIAGFVISLAIERDLSLKAMEMGYEQVMEGSYKLWRKK